MQLPEKVYKNLDTSTKFMRFTIPLPMFAYPIYLWRRSPGKKGSHFNPYSDLFAPHERKAVLISTLCWTSMVLLLLYSSFLFGFLPVLKIYGIPYLVSHSPLPSLPPCLLAFLFSSIFTAARVLYYAFVSIEICHVTRLIIIRIYMIFVAWLDMVTYLHHHGYEQKLPWYRGKEWSYLRGGLTTIDRDYGIINNIHHDIGTHVIHHLFPQIPHYHLVEATRAAKPVLGKYYREPKKSGAFPWHLFGYLARSLGEDHYVSDTGEVVFYQSDPEIFTFSKPNNAKTKSN
ncbi:unnamed protein product [Linum tenue]|uniref:Fatty acid desaturase domain-containing protein n=1 Tax=Linum tenue TaxID=586396 RepID=A0AAV0Q585_9ROSI|nr:unnamed protein product [Linum tenue]